MSSFTKNFDDHVVVNNKKFRVHADVDMYHDKLYGQDIDGNRAVPTTFVEGVELTEIEDENGGYIEIDSLDEATRDKFVEAVQDVV